ncbi:unnamed protein product [Discosporangium mesarthrocarpum]
MGDTPNNGLFLSRSVIRVEDWLHGKASEHSTNREHVQNQARYDFEDDVFVHPEAIPSSRHIVSRSGRRNPVLHRRLGAEELRRGANAKRRIDEAREKEQREVTGIPEITRQGRSMHRSLDDLLIFKRFVEENRRRRRDLGEELEAVKLTNHPKTCSGSAKIIGRMHRRRGPDEAFDQLVPSQRLYRDAQERLLRQRDRHDRACMAARHRANPELSARSMSLPPSQEKFGDRLHSLAARKQQDAEEREERRARSILRGSTFRPEISKRSALLAERQRGAIRASPGGIVQNEGVSGVSVEQMLLAVGEVYKQRKKERLTRQAEREAAWSDDKKVNRCSERLLAKVKVKTRQGGNVCDGPASGQGLPSTFTDLGTPLSWAVDNTSPSADCTEDTFTPRLEALEKTNRILMRRYGGKPMPQMMDRQKAWEDERVKREEAVVRGLHEDAARELTFSPFLEGRKPVCQRRKGLTTGEGGESVGNKNIADRTKDFLLRREIKRAAWGRANLEDEMAKCTFMPHLSARHLGTPGSTDHPITCPWQAQGDCEGKEGPGDTASAAGGQGAYRHGRTPRSKTKKGTTEIGGQKDRPVDQLLLRTTSGSRCCIMSRETGPTSPCQPMAGFSSSFPESSEISDEKLGRKDIAVMPKEGAGGTWVTGASRLPAGWLEFMAPEGSPYYFNAVNGCTQWEMPCESVDVH